MLGISNDFLGRTERSSDMIKDEALRLIHHQSKTTIFMPDGSLVPIMSEKRTICNVHLMLAHLTQKAFGDAQVRIKMLQLIDEAYDMGKRMDKGLMFYRVEMGLSKTQGRELEKKMLDKVDWSKEDVAP